MIIDSHCHLQFEAYEDDREEVIENCRDKNTRMILVGTQQDTSQKAVKLAEENQDMWASVGLHPIQSKEVKVEEEDTSFVARGEDFNIDFYRNLIEDSDNVVAVGETGLDQHHIPEDQDIDKLMDEQWSAYKQHVKLAQEFNLPVIMHIRSAHDEMISRLRDINLDYDGVVHCFSSNWEHAKEYLEMGFHISFTGIITFPPKSSNPDEQHNLWEAVEKTPLEKILVETDAPFLAPQKYRGDRAEPWMTHEVIKKIAEIKDLEVQKVKEQTVSNTQKLFKI
ncbi:MAG: TatD family hydrolase [Candidatus Magasanikbacteria bacterium]